MQIVNICQLFGWDYHTYMQQPIFFLQLISDKLQIDIDEAKKRNNIK